MAFSTAFPATHYAYPDNSAPDNSAHERPTENELIPGLPLSRDFTTLVRERNILCPQKDVDEAECERCDRNLPFAHMEAKWSHLWFSRAHHKCNRCGYIAADRPGILHHWERTGHASVCRGCNGGGGAAWSSKQAYHDHVTEAVPCAKCKLHTVSVPSQDQGNLFPFVCKCRGQVSASREVSMPPPRTAPQPRNTVKTAASPKPSVPIKKESAYEKEEGELTPEPLPPSRSHSRFFSHHNTPLVSSSAKKARITLDHPNSTTAAVAAVAAAKTTPPSVLQCWGCDQTFPANPAGMLNHLESGNCPSRIDAADLGVTAAQCTSWASFTAPGHRAMLLEGELPPPGSRAAATAIHPYRCPSPHCPATFKCLSALFQHAASKPCYPDSVGNSEYSGRSAPTDQRAGVCDLSRHDEGLQRLWFWLELRHRYGMKVSRRMIDEATGTEVYIEFD